jgi:hypothetical protein
MFAFDAEEFPTITGGLLPETSRVFWMHTCPPTVSSTWHMVASWLSALRVPLGLSQKEAVLPVAVSCLTGMFVSSIGRESALPATRLPDGVCSLLQDASIAAEHTSCLAAGLSTVVLYSTNWELAKLAKSSLVGVGAVLKC